MSKRKDKKAAEKALKKAVPATEQAPISKEDLESKFRTHLRGLGKIHEPRKQREKLVVHFGGGIKLA